MELKPVDINDRYADKTDESCEFHIAGVVVFGRIEALQRITRALAALPGAQVHGSSADGKIVLTLESDRSACVAEQLQAVQSIPDVISTALVYQHHEAADPLTEDIDDETDSSRVH
ncbi:MULTISPECIES: chaperone NapD [Caballeronia]|jgi:nitrate reductase NapD|uniref:Chaperone NapD n=1 Tax=Caballeronia zhejiangensis TaxID=871203 RepID=A0A656QIV4_9BURK|nr:MULTISPECIES: chaperone NapD [Caballeronia]EKS70462.1 NapD family protein [Burkholderia sp. SJ98]KDR29004.1 glutamate synthase [Caballeronia zhejiangensis]MDR5790980.1 chaperone NapD [Caballeronia sp. LP003]MDR5796506.1 chaperone NapD [Caballeronia sp. LZ008]